METLEEKEQWTLLKEENEFVREQCKHNDDKQNENETLSCLQSK